MSDDELDIWKGRHNVHTIIFNLAEQRQLAVLNVALWPPIGGVIELGQPNRDCVVVGVRLAIAVPGTDGEVSIIVDVNEGEPGDFIPRHPLDRPRE